MTGKNGHEATRRTKHRIAADRLTELESLIGEIRQAIAGRRGDISPKDLPVWELAKAKDVLGGALRQILDARTRAGNREMRGSFQRFLDERREEKDVQRFLDDQAKGTK
jgi:hypothetical protein